MQIAIVGLAGSGKTTVFNTLTRGHAETGGYGGVTLNVGVVKVPDGRLDTLAFKPVARLGYSEYTTTENVWKMRRPDDP